MGVVEAEQTTVAAIVQRQLAANAVRPRLVRFDQPDPAFGPRAVLKEQREAVQVEQCLQLGSVCFGTI